MEEITSVDTGAQKDVESFKNPYSFILKAVFKKKLAILFVIGLFFLIGVLYIFLAKKEYSAQATILPQITSSKGLSKKYANIASLVGLNLGNDEGSKIVPTLYPVLIDNLFFQRELLNTNVKTLQTRDTITYGDYISKYYDEGAISSIKENTIGLPGKIVGLFRSKPVEEDGFIYDGVDKISSKELKQIGVLVKQLNVSFDELDGVLKIKATTYDPILSEQLVKRCEEILQKTIIELSIEKSRNDLIFLEKRLEIALKDYNSKRGALGTFRDRNKYALTSYTKNIEEQLQAEYELSYDIYSQLASQLENAKLQIAKDTPIFTTIKPPFVPNESSSMGSFSVLVISGILGLFIGVILITVIALKPIASSYIKKEFKD